MNNNGIVTRYANCLHSSLLTSKQMNRDEKTMNIFMGFLSLMFEKNKGLDFSFLIKNDSRPVDSGVSFFRSIIQFFVSLPLPPFSSCACTDGFCLLIPISITKNVSHAPVLFFFFFSFTSDWYIDQRWWCSHPLLLLVDAQMSNEIERSSWFIIIRGRSTEEAVADEMLHLFVEFFFFFSFVLINKVIESKRINQYFPCQWLFCCSSPKPISYTLRCLFT